MLVKKAYLNAVIDWATRAIFNTSNLPNHVRAGLSGLIPLNFK